MSALYPVNDSDYDDFTDDDYAEESFYTQRPIEYPNLMAITMEAMHLAEVEDSEDDEPQEPLSTPEESEDPR
jgi:hypothetical protein